MGQGGRGQGGNGSEGEENSRKLNNGLIHRK